MASKEKVMELQQHAIPDDIDEYGSSYTDGNAPSKKVINVQQLPSDDEEENSGSGSYYTGTSDEEGDTESGSGSEDDSDEPLLKYTRFAKDVVNCLNPTQGETKNVIECMAVHSKYIVLGTFDGSIMMVDHTGTVLPDRHYQLHNAKINQISMDEDEEFMACCSDDGRVSLIGLFNSKHNSTVQFDRAIKSIAIHPHYGKPANRVFVAGSDKLQFVEERRWPLVGHKMQDLNQGYGVVSVIKWKDIYIAWANEKAVFVYDTTLKDVITWIRFEEESPSYLPSSLCWVKSGVLLVGKGHLVKVKSDSNEMLEYSGGVDAMTKKKKCMAISAQNTFPDYIVCGVVPIQIQPDKDKWDMVVLGYDANVNQEEACVKGEVPPTHLIVVPPGYYDSDTEEFETVVELSCDKLLPRGYSYCRAQEYHLECVMMGDEDRFYVVTPIDIILAQKTTPSDHIDWLIGRGKFKEAMQFVENPNNSKSSKPYESIPPAKIKDTGIKYIYHLIDTENYGEAARKSHSVLGEDNATRWEDIIYCFRDKKQLRTILPFIPKRKPKLEQAVYEIVLNEFLLTDTELLLITMNSWSSELYNSKVIMNAVEKELMKHEDTNLLKVKAKLHEDMKEPHKALDIYLKLGDVEVFDLIKKENLHTSLLENLQYLMRLGEEELQKTVELLLDFRSEDCIPPSKVVKKIESFQTQESQYSLQAGSKYFLHRYLDALFQRDPKGSSTQYHERQVSLYADYDQKKLLPFLRACNDIPLQKALDVCRSRQLHEAMVFLLDRMGNPQAALQIIVSDLQDVDKAILFVREKDDEELWDNLIFLSKDLPEFITGLLQNAGTHIDPTKLIKEIPEELCIDNLGSSLAKLLNDYQLQVSLQEGCKKILVKDSHTLMEKLHKLNNKAVCFNMAGSTCLSCSSELLVDESSVVKAFFCGHMYHSNCTAKRNEVDICHLCYRSSRNKATPTHK